MFEKMKLRGVPKGPFSSPKGFEILLREMRLFSQSFYGSQDRLKAQEKSILKIATSTSSPKNVSLDVIKIDVLLRL
jgi:hypothetical protein